jgi:signal transduction histidine kinase
MKNNAHTKTVPAAYIYMGGGLVISILIAVRLYWNDDDRIRREFMHTINTYALSINEQVHEDIAILYSFEGLFNASEEVSRSEFHSFASILLARYPTMQGVGWIPRIRANERERAEQRAQKDGVDGFQITERQEQGSMIRAGQRDEYYPVYFIEPFKENKLALGFNLVSHPKRREALYIARDSGEAQATERIILVQEKTEAWAVLFFVPVYNGSPTNTNERRKSIRGFISGVFRIEDILLAAEAHIPSDSMIDILLIDKTDERQTELLHKTDHETAEFIPAYRYTKSINLGGGRTWRLVATPSKAYLAEQRSIIPYGSLLLGLFITGGLSHYLTRLAKENERVEQQVRIRTQELQTQSTALTESNANLKREVVQRKQLQKQFAEVTDHEQRRLGQELHDSLGQQVAVAAMMAQSLQGRLAAEGPEASQSNRLTKSIQIAQTQIRSISKGLLPVDIDPAGLKDALAELVLSVRGLNEFDVNFVYDEGVVVADNTAATQLYRIAQEALRNALEHGEATQITIYLRLAEHGLTLTIQDEGNGFSSNMPKSSGSGLTIMRHRAELIGATFTIESHVEKGTSVSCCLADPTCGVS